MFNYRYMHIDIIKGLKWPLKNIEKHYEALGEVCTWKPKMEEEIILSFWFFLGALYAVNASKKLSLDAIFFSILVAIFITVLIESVIKKNNRAACLQLIIFSAVAIILTSSLPPLSSPELLFLGLLMATSVIIVLSRKDKRLLLLRHFLWLCVPIEIIAVVVFTMI